MSVKNWVKTRYRRKFGKHLTQQDLRGFRNILKLLYHKNASTPLKDPNCSKYFISVPKLHLDLIINEKRAELVNTSQIYPLELNEEVFKRAVEVIRQEVTKQRTNLENELLGKKDTILNNIFKTII